MNFIRSNTYLLCLPKNFISSAFFDLVSYHIMREHIAKFIQLRKLNISSYQ